MKTGFVPSARRGLLGLVVIASGLLAACGGGGGDPADGPASPPVQAAPLGNPVTATVGAAGGTVAFAASGVVATLSFPAGGLESDTAVTVTPLAPAADEWARVQIDGPAGVLETPATLTLHLPEAPGAEAAGVRVEALGVLPLPTTTAGADGRSLVIELQDFGADAAAPASASGRMHALAARPLASTPPAPPPVAARKALTPQERLDALRISIERHKLEPSVRSALRANMAIANVLRLLADPKYAADALREIAQASDKACTALRNALAVAEFFPVPANMNASDPNESQRIIFNVIGPVLYWEAVVTQLGGDPCKDADVDAVLNGKLAGLLNWVKAKKATQQDATGFGQIVKPPAQAAQLASHARILKAPQLERIVNTAFVEPAMAPLRSIAWDASNAGTTHDHYRQVFALYGLGTPLADDVQLVGTALQVGSYSDAAAKQVEGQATMGRKATPESSIKAWTVSAKSGGKVSLEGPIQVLKCPLPASERLVVEFEGAEVLSQASSGDLLLQGTLSFEINRLLNAAGIQPANATQHVLRLWRKGSGCNASFGLGDATVAEITLDFSKTCRAAPGTTHCVTVLTDANGVSLRKAAEGGFRWEAFAIADGGTVGLRRGNKTNAGGAGLWKDGRVTEVAPYVTTYPADPGKRPFTPAAMNESGDMAGYVYDEETFGSGSGENGTHPAIVRNGQLAILGGVWGSYGAISDAGSATGGMTTWCPPIVNQRAAMFWGTTALRDGSVLGPPPDCPPPGAENFPQPVSWFSVNSAGQVCQGHLPGGRPRSDAEFANLCSWINDYARLATGSNGVPTLTLLSGAPAPEYTPWLWQLIGARYMVDNNNSRILDLKTGAVLPAVVPDGGSGISWGNALTAVSHWRMDTLGRVVVNATDAIVVLTPRGVKRP